MVVSKEEIANLTISQLGETSFIEDFLEESPAARQMRLWYSLALDQALSAYNWSFAKRLQALATHTSDPPAKWGYRYQYPTDCLKARYIVNPLGEEADAIPFDVTQSPDGLTKCILTNQAEAELIFTRRTTLVELYTPFFVTTFSYLLGHYTAKAITGDDKIADRMLQQYINLINIAEAHDGNEGVEDRPREAEWIRARK